MGGAREYDNITGCIFFGESENGFLILDYLDSSLPKKRRIQKQIFLYFETYVYCMSSATSIEKMPGSLFFIIEELVNLNIELQQCLQSSNDDDGKEHMQCRNF